MNDAICYLCLTIREKSSDKILINLGGVYVLSMVRQCCFYESNDFYFVSTDDFSDATIVKIGCIHKYEFFKKSQSINFFKSFICTHRKSK